MCAVHAQRMCVCVCVSKQIYKEALLLSKDRSFHRIFDLTDPFDVSLFNELSGMSTVKLNLR